MNQMTFQKICAWSGVICLILFFIGFAFAGFIPPMSPSLSIDEVVAHYQQRTTGIRIGMGFMLISSPFYAMLTAVISGQMRRIPGLSPTAVYAQLACGAFACLTFLMPAIFFLVTSFRPDRPPELTFMLNDLSWIMLVIPWMPFMPQNFSFAFAIFSDRRPDPLFPRWFGFLNIWTPICFTPATLLPFFKSGPFAWNGLITLWIPAIILVTWSLLTAVMVSRAVAVVDGTDNFYYRR